MTILFLILATGIIHSLSIIRALLLVNVKVQRQIVICITIAYNFFGRVKTF